jgi:hypothetical protein
MDDFSMPTPLALAVVFDLSDQRSDSGHKLAEMVRRELRQFITADPLRLAYVALEKNHMPKDNRESYAQLNRYVEPEAFLVGEEFKRAVKVLGENGDNYRKVVALFTDRFQYDRRAHYWTGFQLNAGRHYGCDILICGVGRVRDEQRLQELTDSFAGRYQRVVTLNDMVHLLKGIA